VLDFSFKVLAVLIGPLYAYGLYVEWPGVSFNFVINAVIQVYLLVFTVFNLKLGLRIKKHILLFILFYGNTYTLYNLGFFGGGRHFMILLFCVAFFYYNRRFAYIIIVSNVAYYFVYMYLYTEGIVTYYAPAEDLVNNKIIWIADFNLTLVTAIISAYAIIKTFKAYHQKEIERAEDHKRLNYTLDNLPIPVAALTVEEKIPYFNDKFQEFFGYTIDEMPSFGHWLEKVYPETSTRVKVGNYARENMSRAFKDQKQLPLEYLDFRTKKGELKSAEVHHTFFGDTAICAFIDLTERRKKKRLIVETMMQAEERENMRIAQELHDGVGPLLTTAKIYAHTLMLKCKEEDKSGIGNKLNGLLDNSIKELRNTINNVSPQILQRYGLVKAIDSFIGQIQLLTSIKFTIENHSERIKNPVMELALYRALVELVNNSVKYARAKVVNIWVTNENGSLLVYYKDDGIGFDFEIEKTKGYGLTNITNRIETIGGSFDLMTGKGAGVEVIMSFDLKLDES
jgi:signal transduction histidine kinase